MRICLKGWTGLQKFSNRCVSLSQFRFLARESRNNSRYLAARTPPPPLPSRRTGPDTSLESSFWSLHCQGSGKLPERGRREKSSIKRDSRASESAKTMADLELRQVFCTQDEQPPAHHTALLCCEDVQGGRRLRWICCRRSRILCLSCWISESLSPSSSASSSCRRMLYFISSMAAMSDSEMLKWAFSYIEQSETLWGDERKYALWLRFQLVSVLKKDKEETKTFSRSAQLPKSCSDR